MRSMRKSSLPKKRSAAVEGEKGEDRSEGADADASQEKRSKKKRRSTEHSNLVLQAIPKARNIGDSRLTVRCSFVLPTKRFLVNSSEFASHHCSVETSSEIGTVCERSGIGENGCRSKM